MVIITIVAAVVVVVIIVGAAVAFSFLTGVQQAANLSKPNVAITNTDGTYTEDCGTYGTQTTDFHLSATLVNTGGAGFCKHWV